MYIYLKNWIDCILGWIGQKPSEMCPKSKERLMEEIRRSIERNSFRNVAKIKRKYATVISGLHICTKIQDTLYTIW